MGTRWTITVDCAAARGLARFWAGALGYELMAAPEGFGSWEAWFVEHGVPEDEWDDVAAVSDPDGVGPQISFLRVPEGRVGKNRLHLDLQVSGGRQRPGELRQDRIRTEVQRLTGLGARVLQEHPGTGGWLDHVVLADPEGNEFCVV